MTPYPEIFELSNIDNWVDRYLRKEILTKEWDLSLWEISQDIFEIPVFTPEFCDKFILNCENNPSQKIEHWGHTCDKVESPIELNQIMDLLIDKFMVDAFYHVWKVDINSVKKMDWIHSYLRFHKNQDLRIRHDETFVTIYLNLDSSRAGGDLFFPKYNFTLVPKQGHAYFYPGRLTHRYGMTMVKSEKTNNIFTNIDFK